jgi:hypothetical protein
MTPLHKGTYIGLTVVAVLVSIFTIYYAIHIHCATHAGDGGALAVALSFAFLFLGGGYATLDGISDNVRRNIARYNRESPDKPITDDELREMVLDQLVQKLRSDDSVLVWQKWSLTISSVLGTFGWAYGGYIAIWFVGPTCPK